MIWEKNDRQGEIGEIGLEAGIIGGKEKPEIRVQGEPLYNPLWFQKTLRIKDLQSL